MSSTKVWEFFSILSGEDLPALYENTIWAAQVSEIRSQFASAVRDQDRRFLDSAVPTEALVYGVKTAGLTAYRSDNGYIRTNPPGESISLASLVTTYGSAFVADVLEAGLALEPI